MPKSFVGQSVPRVDGLAKVRGTAAYVDDILVPGALYGGTVRSDIARGRLIGIRRDPSFDWTSVLVLTHEDVTVNVVALLEEDQPVLAAREIRHCYEPVALVACADPVRLKAAIDAITLDIEPLPPILDMEAALAAEEEALRRGSGNGLKRDVIEHELGGASIESRLDACEVTLRGRYRVHHQEQLYIEPQGMIAWWSSAGVHITGSLQSPYSIQRIIKRAFDLDDNHVHITQAVTGGGFGGKEDYPGILAAHAALLARAARRPVRMIYGRREDIESTTKRHPARVDIVTGCTKDGALIALDVRCVLDGGAYLTSTPLALSRAMVHAGGAYAWKHARIEGLAVKTNTPPNGAFRGFGAPQTIWAIERHMDRLARVLEKEPLAFKRASAMAIGSVTVTGQRLEESVGIDECVARAMAASGYAEKRAAYDRAPASQRVRRGIGASVYMHGAGSTGSDERSLKARVRVDLETGGRLRVRSSATDSGQGTETVFCQIAADAAEVSLHKIAIENPCTTNVPDSGPMVASRSVMVVGKLVASGAKAIADRVRVFAAARGLAIHDAASWAVASDAFLMHEGRAVSELVEAHRSGDDSRGDDAHDTRRDHAYPCYAWGCDIVEVEVDLDTFETRVVAVWAAQDVGKAIHPVMCAGQVEGGALQAIGWALYENVVWKDGKIMNARMTDYVIPTSKDAPLFHTILVEHPYSGGPRGAKGVGESTTDGAAPAVAAAIEHALGHVTRARAMGEERSAECGAECGADCNDLPLSPEKLFAAFSSSSSLPAHAGHPEPEGAPKAASTERE